MKIRGDQRKHVKNQSESGYDIIMMLFTLVIA